MKWVVFLLQCAAIGICAGSDEGVEPNGMVEDFAVHSGSTEESMLPRGDSLHGEEHVVASLKMNDRLLCSSQNAVLEFPDAIALYTSLDEPEVGFLGKQVAREKGFLVAENDFIGIYGETFYDRDSAVQRDASAIVTRNVSFETPKPFDDGVRVDTSVFTAPIIRVEEAELQKFSQALHSQEGLTQQTVEL